MPKRKTFAIGIAILTALHSTWWHSTASVGGDNIRKIALDKCQKTECIMPYLVYNKLVLGGQFAHTGFLHVKDNQVQSYALNNNGRVMAPDQLLEGSAKVPPGRGAVAIADAYQITKEKSAGFSQFIEDEMQRKRPYSMLELNGGENCATLVTAAMGWTEVGFTCELPGTNIKVTDLCRVKTK
jgi:hypothetical protein